MGACQARLCSLKRGWVGVREAIQSLLKHLAKLQVGATWGGMEAYRCWERLAAQGLWVGVLRRLDEAHQRHPLRMHKPMSAPVLASGG